MTERARRSNSFVLRIWWEDAAQPVWRGWVQHAATGETHCFQRLGDLLAFIEGHTGSLAQTTGRKSDGVVKEAELNDP